jgi:hypothetical protein
MRKLTGGALVVAAMLAAPTAVPATADAAPIRECGEFRLPYAGWSVWNVTTRKVNCRTARIQADRTITRSANTPVGRSWWNPYMRMTCLTWRYAAAKYDTRCVRGGRVNRFQWGRR